MQERRRMNERIRALKEQATRTAMWPGDPDAGELDAEKFAELIVRECVGICECEWNGDADTFAASEAYNECADAIKEHFGVKE
jgi:hypothetical protein